MNTRGIPTAAYQVLHLLPCRGTPPARSDGGGTRGGVPPQPGLTGGIPEVGYPLAGVPPSQVRQGVPKVKYLPSWTWLGYPSGWTWLWVPPNLDLAGVPPWGADLAGVPHPTLDVKRQPDSGQTRVKTIFPSYTYAVGNNIFNFEIFGCIPSVRMPSQKKLRFAGKVLKFPFSGENTNHWRCLTPSPTWIRHCKYPM